jgi:signal transduction histidine kinase
MFACVFAVAACLLLGVVRHQVGRYAHEATAGALATETATLMAEERAALPGVIARRMAAAPNGGFEYLLLDARGHAVVGAIPAGAGHVGPGSVVMSERGDAHPERLVTLGTRLGDGALLVVATDGYDVDRLRHHMIRFTILWAIVVTLLALLGGWWAGRLFVKRLAAVNAAVERIMAGRLEQRLPAIGLAPELDELSRNLNRMLDRIDGLMEGLRQVSTDVAHDLRTPLTRLRQTLEAARDAPGRGEVDAGIEVAIAQADHLLGVFRAILRLAQIEGGGRRARFATVDLGALLAGLIETYEPVAADAGHRLVAPAQAPATVEGDAELLAQLFANLIENAILHTPAGTEVRIGIAREQGGVIATVADTGPGVPEAERANILRRFYQLDPSRGSGSAGLGLSLAAAIATLHEARLTIGDAAPGLTVKVAFPHG